MFPLKIIGYTNPLCSISAPIVTIANEGKNYYAIFPDSSFKLLNIYSNEDLEKIESLILENDNKIILKGQSSYIDHNETIITDYFEELIEFMNNDLILLKTKDSEHYSLLKNLLVSEIDKKKTDSSCSEQKVRFYTTERIKSDKQKAKRVILQFNKNGSLRTVYKKNLHSNNPIEESIESNRFDKPLKKALLSLSDRLKDSSIKYLYLANVA